ncbi:MAG: deoxyribonuclease IV [bacterium]|jgi:deoxyribonuclease-4
MEQELYLGAHLTTTGGFARAAETAAGIGANTFQFFSRNPRGARSKLPEPADVKKMADYLKAERFGPLVGHAPYIVNLASAQAGIWDLAVTVLREDLAKIAAVGCPYLVVHPGSHTGSGAAAGIARVAAALDEVLPQAGDGMVLLETMAGMGTEVGVTFEQMAAIIGQSEYSERIGVCLDTCHVFAAGYDVKEDFSAVLDEFDRIIGLSRLKAMHVNDSKFPCGSRKDRHANLGEGNIGREGFARILQDKRTRGLPLILETPGGTEEYEREIAFLRSLI